MKKQLSNLNILSGIFFCFILGFTSMAFQDSSKVNKTIPQVRIDTAPKINNVDIDLKN